MQELIHSSFTISFINILIYIYMTTFVKNPNRETVQRQSDTKYIVTSNLERNGQRANNTRTFDRLFVLNSTCPLLDQLFITYFYGNHIRRFPKLCNLIWLIELDLN